MVQPTLQQHLRPSSCCPKRSWAPTTTTKLATSLRSSSSLRSIGLLALLLVSAVQQYNSSTPNKILVWNDDDDAADNRARSLDYALRCLRQTTPQLNNSTVTYFTDPRDAREHFATIHEGLAPWTKDSQPHCAAGYCGPWIENRWIEAFQRHATQPRRSWVLGSGTNDWIQTFGPYVPLLIPWTDIWVNSNYQYPPGFVDTLRSLLRPDVLYITVSQNDEGISGKATDRLRMADIPNVLVLSAGGYGHVPIPLFKQDEPLIRNHRQEERPWRLSYVGDLTHAPREMRQRMHQALRERNSTAAAAAVDGSSSSFSYTYYHGPNWRSVMETSDISVVPRGFGRTSYHLMETLQRGLVPLHVYMDTPWVPYRTVYEEQLGLLASVDELSDMRFPSLADLRARERRIASYRHSHFSWSGFLDQHLRPFLTDPLHDRRSDLECQALPATVRAAEEE